MVTFLQFVEVTIIFCHFFSIFSEKKLTQNKCNKLKYKVTFRSLINEKLNGSNRSFSLLPIYNICSTDGHVYCIFQLIAHYYVHVNIGIILTKYILKLIDIY